MPTVVGLRVAAAAHHSFHTPRLHPRTRADRELMCSVLNPDTLVFKARKAMPMASGLGTGRKLRVTRSSLPLRSGLPHPGRKCVTRGRADLG